MKGQEQACLLGLLHTFPLLAPKLGLAREMLKKVVLDAGIVTGKSSVLFRAMQERGLLLRQILEVALGMRTYGRRTAGKTEQT